MQKEKNYLGYVLIDPNTNIPRYVGITTKTLHIRFLGHLRDIRNRPNLNPHKTNWFKKLFKEGKIPRIELVKECANLEELKQFEIDYIKKYKDKYNLINMTPGGDWVGENAHTRETILKKSTTRAVTQYNILGEKIADYEVMEDIMRAMDLREKACSHITQCCKGTRKYAYGYVWRYKDEPLGDLSNINPRSLDLNYLVQYDINTGERLGEFQTAKEAAEAVGLKSTGNLSSVIAGRQKTFGGYEWKIEPNFVYFDQNLFDNLYKQPFLEKNRNTNGLKVICFDLNNNKVGEFDSISQASVIIYPNMSSVTRRHISKCCNGEEDSYKGYKWKRVTINPSNSVDEPTKVNTELNECETTIENTSNDGSE